MGPTQRHLRSELERLQRQRDRYVKAAHTGSERTRALRHLLNAERLAEEIHVLRDALAELPTSEEDVTLPIRNDDQTVVRRVR